MNAALSLVAKGNRLGLALALLLLTAAPAHAAGHHHVMHAQLGKVRAELSYDEVSPGFWQHSRLKIYSGKRLVVNRPVGVFAPIYGSRPIAVRQLDGAGPPEVLLTEFSGGNGCCFTNWIYEGAKRIKAPWLDPPKIRDADGDGKPEFHGLGAGLGLWGSRADASAPVAVWSYYDGAVHDVTRSFPAEIQADQASHYAAYQTRRADGDVGGARDAISAYVADGYLLGQGDAAMAVVQAAVNAGQLDDPGTDSSGADFVDQITAALREQGYTS